MARRFKDLSVPEVLALAVSLEEEDARLLQEFARLLRPNYPKAAEDGRDAQGGGHAPAPAGGTVPAEVRDEIPLDAAAGRPRFRAARPGAIGPPLGRPTGPPPSGLDGAGDAAVLHAGRPS